MFERFSESARHVVVHAQRETVTLRHDAIEPEHILIGIAAEMEAIGGRVLAELGVTADRAREQVQRLCGVGQLADTAAARGQIPFAPQTKTVFERALRDAMSGQAGHADVRPPHSDDRICTSHLLLAVLDQSNSIAIEALQALGADPETIREAIGREPAEET